MLKRFLAYYKPHKKLLAMDLSASLLISLIGIIRLPDFFTRLHAQGVADTLGALLIIISMMMATGAGLMSVKLFLVIVMILVTNPVGTNLMMMAGMNNKEYREYKKYKKAGKGDEDVTDN